MAAMLEKNKTLKSLRFKGQIGDKGQIAMATALEQNATLTSFGLGPASDEGATAMAAMLKKNKTLKEFGHGSAPARPPHRAVSSAAAHRLARASLRGSARLRAAVRRALVRSALLHC